jgi:predicted N-formylglutamate amidohydrolase
MSRQASLTLRDDDGASAAAVERPFGRAPVLLICEHASNAIPAMYGDLGLTAAERESHIAWDPGALGVARRLGQRLDAPLVHATVSRLVIDLNRDPTAHDSIVTVSEATAVPGNAALGEVDRADRVRTVYEGFHATVDALLASRADPTRAVVSVHSFTPVYHGVVRPWHVGLIHDADGRLAERVAGGLLRDPELAVGINEPYSPADRVFHTLERHAVRRGLAPLMIEIRNDLIGDADGQEAWASRLAPLIEEAVRTL